MTSPAQDDEPSVVAFIPTRDHLLLVDDRDIPRLHAAHQWASKTFQSMIHGDDGTSWTYTDWRQQPERSLLPRTDFIRFITADGTTIKVRWDDAEPIVAPWLT